MPPSNHHIKRIQKRQKEFVEDLNIGQFAGSFSLEWNGPETFNTTTKVI